jgi:methionyl-tRNA formyltransferase
MKKKLIFMGTPQFAVASLQALLECDSVEIVAVYTQPDKEAGRGRKIGMPAVKEFALQKGLKIMQPESLKSEDAVADMKNLSPDVTIVSAYGKIIPENILAIPAFGCLNIHPSLLPQYRGATPIPSAILNGDRVTGVSVMLLDPGMDTGPVFRQCEEEILDVDTAETLSDRLAGSGARVLMEVLPAWLEGEIKPVPQDNSKATYTAVISKEDGRADWTRSAVEIWRKVRAYQPWPGCYTNWKEKNLKIAAAVPLDIKAGEPGTIISIKDIDSPVGVGISCGSGVLGLLRVQIEGKREMAVDEFMRGQADFTGSKVL